MQLQNRKCTKKNGLNNNFTKGKYYCRGVSRIEAKSNMELFITKVNCF